MVPRVALSLGATRATDIHAASLAGVIRGYSHAIEPMQEPGKGLRTYWWQDLVGVARSISAEAPSAQAIAIEYWKVREDTAGRCGCRQEIRAVRWPCCERAIAWRRGMERLELDDEDEIKDNMHDEKEHEDDIAVLSEDSDGDPPSTNLGVKASRAKPLTGLGVEAPNLEVSAPTGRDRDEPDPLHQWVAAAQRSSRGHRFEVRGGPEGFVFEMLLTYRKPGTKAPFGGYQATCFHHDPGLTMGLHGKSSKLACRKEVPCETEGDDRRIVDVLHNWICSASGFDDRLSHMRSLRRERKKLGDRPKKPGRLDCRDDSSSSGSSDTTTGRPDLAPSAPSAPDKIKCWVCSGPHRTEQCYFMTKTLADSMGSAMHSRMVRGKDAVVLARADVVLRDVPSDGNCFFHALQCELRGSTAVRRPSLLRDDMPQGTDGQALREWFLKYITTTTDIIDGMAVSRWLDRPIEQYCREMRHGDVADERTWGGFPEAAIIANTLPGLASVLLLDIRDDGAHAITWSRPSVRDPARIVCLAWLGRHWQRARMSAGQWEALFKAWPLP